MASKITILGIVVTVLMVNGASSFMLLEPLYRVQRAAASENPAVELNNLVSETLSRENAQLLLKSVLPDPIENLFSRLDNEDLLSTLVKSYVENPNSGLSHLQANGTKDIQTILEVLNEEIGEAVLITANEAVAIDVNALEKAVVAYARTYIKQLYSSDILLQIVLTETLKQQIQIAFSELKPLLANKTIPVELVTNTISLTSSNRSKRDLVDDIVLEVIRSLLGDALSPIQQNINNVLNNVISLVSSLYTSQQPTDNIAALITNVINIVILRVVELLTDVQSNINAFCSNVINGAIVSANRKRRDVDLEFENFYNFDETDLAISHRRVTRDANPIQGLIDLIGSLLSGLVDILNILLKNIVAALLSSQYGVIGQLVTTPLRVVVNWLIDTILPCTTCISIV